MGLSSFKHILALVLSAVVAAGLFSGCRHDSDPRLAEIAEMADNDPESALGCLDGIDRSSLSEADRHYFDLLTIKARDKAFVAHGSDSLVLDVIDYYESHSSRLYPEALYYGGRVYSDLGDYPSALGYFQRSLDLMPSSDGFLKLRAAVTSQTGWLLDKLRMSTQSVPYYKEAIRLDSLLSDTTGYVIDLEMLSKAYANQGKTDSAELALGRIIGLGNNLPEAERAQVRMMQAGIKMSLGMPDSALSYIRGVPESIHSQSRPEALAYACDIYMKAGILDSAYLYARELALDTESDNRKTGFGVLLSPELAHMVPADSIAAYTSLYRKVVDEFLRRHDRRQTLLQVSEYNYRLHEKARLEAERQSMKAGGRFKWAVIVILILLLGIVVIDSRHKAKLLSLHEELHRLRRPVGKIREEKSMSGRQEDLRKEIIDELLELHAQKRKSFSVPSAILESDVYKTMIGYLDSEKVISDSNPLWKDLENLVGRTYPQLKKRLSLLAVPSLKRHDLQIILLVKCGVTPTQLTILLGKTKGTISSRRAAISQRLFDQKLANSMTDELIRLL